MTARPAAATLLFASGLVAGVVQVVLIRELMLTCFGNEVALGLTLASWLVGGAVGAAACSSGPISLARQLLKRKGAGRKKQAVAADGGLTAQPPVLHSTAGPQGGSGTTATGNSRRTSERRWVAESDLRRVLWLVCALVPATFAGVTFARAYPTLIAVVTQWLGEIFSGSPRLERLFTVILSTQPGEMLGPIHLLLVSLGAAALPAVVVGALFAGCLQLYGQLREHDAAAPGQAYALDGLGHLAGGVLLASAALAALNPFLVSCVAGAVLWAVAAWAAREMGCTRAAPLWLHAALLVAGLGGSAGLHKTSHDLRWDGQKLLAEISSVYGHVAVARHGDEGVVFFQNGVPTGLSPGLPSVQEMVQFVMLQHPKPRRILLVGGGAMGGLKEVLKHQPQHVDYVEVDQALIKLAKQWVTAEDRAALHDPRVSTLALDGRLLVKQVEAGRRPPYDVIISMVPDPSTALLNRYYTAEWFREARAALNPGGVLAWQMSSTRHYFRPALRLFNKSVLAAAAAAFPRRVVMPGDDSMVVVVGDETSDLSEDWQTLRRRLEARQIEAGQFAAVAPDRLTNYDRHYVWGELAKAPAAGVNKDLRPVGVFYDQAAWVGLYHPDLEPLYVRLARLRLADLAVPAAAAWGLLLMATLWRPGRGVHVPLAMLVTGALGMVLELCLLLAYQAYYGYVYRQVGVLIGAFMVGMAAGALGAAKLARVALEPRRALWLLAVGQAGLAAMALVLPQVLEGLGSSGKMVALGPAASVPFALMTAVIGAGVGVQFPLATRAGATQAGPVPGGSRTAVGLYAADLVGASVGAATAGALFVPVLGIPHTCLAAALCSGAMAALLALRSLGPS